MSVSLTILFTLCVASDQNRSVDALLSTGHQFLKTGRIAEAESIFREAVRILDTNSASPTAELAVGLNNLATALAARHQFERALPVIRRALFIAAQTLDAPATAQIAANAAQVYIRMGDFGAAKPLVIQAEQACSNTTSSPQFEYVLLLRAELHLAEKNWQQTHAALDLAQQRVGSAPHQVTVGIHHLRGLVWQKSGNRAAAVNEFRAAVEIARQLPDWEESLDSNEFLLHLRDALRQNHQRQLARVVDQELRVRRKN